MTVAPERDAGWQRLDRRMLLVHPIREVVRFLPVLVGVFLAGSAAGGDTWRYLGVLVPVALGLLRYLTTSFRIAQGRVELKRGLLRRHLLSAPVARVRTVDLTASPTHRLLGITTVRIGTGTGSGQDEDALDLDGLPVARARLLREELLRLAPVDDEPLAPAVGEDVVGFDPRWARFAPLTSTGLVLGAGVLGAVTQGLNLVGGVGRLDVSDLADGAAEASAWLAVPALTLAVLVVMSALAVGGYLVANWGFSLRHSRRSWHLTRGLLTTRETTLDDERVAGVSLAEPVGLRLAGGARLSAVVTGLDREQSGSSLLVPPAPREVVVRVAGRVLGTAAPVTGTLVGHGPTATRRRWTRALGPALALLGLAVVATSAGAPAWVLVPAALAVPAAAALAADRSRALGHALVDGHLVARSGSLLRRREALRTEHVIGWTFRDTWFQRRAGLTTLVATTAGGRQAVTLPDVPEGEAVLLARAALPGLVDPFLEEPLRRRAAGADLHSLRDTVGGPPPPL